jgi:large subunit ribosomal protein L9
MATSSAKKMLAEDIKQRAHKEARIRNEAETFAAQRNGVKLTIGAKTSSTGRIFGSVTALQIAEALKEKGFDVDRRTIRLQTEQIKEVGEYKAKIRLHREVHVEIDFEVVSE